MRVSVAQQREQVRTYMGVQAHSYQAAGFAVTGAAASVWRSCLLHKSQGRRC
jgi:hypothetical protein